MIQENQNPSLTLSQPYELKITAPEFETFNSLSLNFNVYCARSNLVIFKIRTTLYFVFFKLGDDFQVQAIIVQQIPSLIDLILSVKQQLILLSTPTQIIRIQIKGNTIVKSSILIMQPTQTVDNICIINSNVIFFRCQNRIQLYKIQNDILIRQSALNVVAQTSEEILKIKNLLIQKRIQQNKYLGLMVAKVYNTSQVFLKQKLFVLEIEIIEGKLATIISFQVIQVNDAEGFLNVDNFYLHTRTQPDKREFLEILLNNQILIIYKLINKYMIWESIYNKKTKQDSKVKTFGLAPNNIFYAVESLHIQIYQFSFVEQKDIKRTVLKTNLTDFIPDFLSQGKPFLSCMKYQDDLIKFLVCINCYIQKNEFKLLIRATIKIDPLKKLEKVIALINFHKQFQKQLPKLVQLISIKKKIDKKQVHKYLWLKWPKVLQKNSESIKKLIAISDPRYIEKQLQTLLKNQNLKIELVEDILLKCQQMYKKQLIKNFNAKMLRYYLKCNFKLKKIRLQLQICKNKIISFEQYTKLKKKNIDQQIKLYFQQFRTTDLLYALPLFSKYFLSNYEQNLEFAFSKIKNHIYLITNFPFIVPSSNFRSIWELNLQRKQIEITKQKLLRYFQASKEKQAPDFMTIYNKALQLTSNSKYMINNDIFTKKEPIKNFQQGYFIFFSCLAKQTKIEQENIIKILEIVAKENEIKKQLIVKIQCNINLYYLMNEQYMSLKQMLELEPQQLFQKLLNLEKYEMFLTIVKQSFSYFQFHKLSNSFYDYLEKYFKKNSIIDEKYNFNKHFTQLLQANQKLLNEEYQLFLQCILNCIYYSMQIRHSEYIQNYIEKYFILHSYTNQSLKNKLLRIQKIIQKQQIFMSINNHFKLVDIQIGQQVLSLMIQNFLVCNMKALQQNEIKNIEFRQYIKGLLQLIEQYYTDITKVHVYQKMIDKILQKVHVYKFILQQFIQIDSNEEQIALKKQIIQKKLIHQRDLYYVNLTTFNILQEKVKYLITQYLSINKLFCKTQSIRLELAHLLFDLESETLVPSLINIQKQQIEKSLLDLIDSQIFDQKLSLQKREKYIALLYNLKKDNQNQQTKKQCGKKIEDVRIRDLIKVCEVALAQQNFVQFLECFEQHLIKCKQKFTENLKILWIKFMGYYIDSQEHDIGYELLKKCLYSISDFKQSMHQFFKYMNNEEELRVINAEDAIKLNNDYYSIKGKKWVLQKIQRINLKIKKNIRTNKNILEFIFRHLLISDVKLAFIFLNKNLNQVDIQNIYKITIICLQSDYFFKKQYIVQELLKCICRSFGTLYKNQTAHMKILQEEELLQLIIKLRPNAKNQQSRNRLTFYDSIISGALQLKKFYKGIGLRATIEQRFQESERNIEAIITTIESFSESILPMLNLRVSVIEDRHDLDRFQIGQNLVESECDQSKLEK